MGMRVRLDSVLTIFDVFGSLVGRCLLFLLVFSLGHLIGYCAAYLMEGGSFEPDAEWFHILTLAPLRALLSVFQGFYYGLGFFFFLFIPVSFIVLFFTDKHPLHPTVWMLLSQSWNTFILHRYVIDHTRGAFWLLYEPPFSVWGLILLLLFTFILLAFYGLCLYQWKPLPDEPWETHSRDEDPEDPESRDPL